MIVRKPYALLIRNFRIIHFLMLILGTYLLYKTNIAYQFFKVYANTRQFISTDTIINDTIPFIIPIFSLLIIFISSSIFILFRKKDKPVLFYVISVIYYLFLIVFSIMSREMISRIIINGLDPRIARIMRDMWLLVFIAEIVLFLFYLIRTLGFDIKRFHFGEDLHELKIEEEDSEEYELNTGIDANKLKMQAAIRKEELKAFYFENRFMIISILFLLLIIIPGVFLIKINVENKRYEINEVIDLDKFEFKVLQVYSTKKNYKGKTLFKNDNSYLIVKFNINNLAEEERGIKLSNLRLEIDNKVYTPNTTYYDQFVDLGTGYIEQKISKDSKEFIAVYVVKDEDLKKDIIVRYTDKITVKKNEASAKYYRINVKPIDVDNDINQINLSINDVLKIGNNDIFKITHYNVKDKFTYKNNDRLKYIVNNIGLVLSLQYEFYKNKDYKDMYDALNSSAIISYKIGDKVYTDEIKNITPSTYNGDEIFLAVNENIAQAEEISIILNFRSTRYIYKIK